MKKKKATSRKKPTRSKSQFSQKSKTKDFLKKLQKNNPMVEYFTRLTVMNPAASKEKDAPKRDGRYVRLAHANEEFEAPVFTKGKSVQKKP